MLKSPASDSRPMPTSWVRISEPFSSHLQNIKEDEVNKSLIITFPTDQVPQPVTRDTIATTTMAASTDSRGSACLPQSAPTVQAQVFSTVAGCVSCDDLNNATKQQQEQHNQADAAADDVGDVEASKRAPAARGAGAGPSVAPVAAPRGLPSVIASRSCPELQSAPTGNFNYYYVNKINNNNNIDKMQSVNVNSSINYSKGLLFECNTAVTVPNTTTKPQRNTAAGASAPAPAPYNNSVKLDIVNVYDKNYDGAFINATDDIPPFVTTTTTTTLVPPPPAAPSNQNNSNNIGLERLIALSKRTRRLEQAGLLRRLGLCGGGESSLSTGTTGWGTPPSTNSNNNNNGWGGTSSANQNNANNQQNWNNNQNRNNPGGGQSGPGTVNSDGSNSNNKSNNGGGGAPVNGGGQNQAPPSSSQAGGWQQPANKNAGAQGGGAAPTSQAPAAAAAQPPTAATPTTSTKQQLEQLNNMREALFAQDGWGGQHVNQDTNWDIPSSPEPQIKMDGSGPPQWKPTVNNGTDLWEVNLRNGGQPPPQPAQKTPWGHTPSTNIGGTWGEDDDVADSSNVWTGVPNNQQQWGGTNTSNGAMWGGPKKDTEWGNSGWDPRNNDPRSGGGGGGGGLDPRDMRIDPRDMRAAGSDAMRMLDPRDQMRLVNSGEMRGDPRGGITGRLNGAQTEAMWGGQPGPHGPQHHLHQPAKMVGPGANNVGVNQWAGPAPKDLTLGGKPTGWEEPSPPSQRRNMPNYDDGTSLWGNPNQQGRGGVAATAGGNLSHWKEIPTGPSASMAARGNGNMGLPPGMARGLKPDATTGGTGAVWGSGARNGTAWDETGHGVGGGAWDEPSGWPSKPTKPTAGLWPEAEIEWGHKPGPKPLSKELVWNSKQFRLLVDMGYKKEDAENALRARDMNLEDALDLLSLQRTTMEGWRTRHDDHFDHQPAPPFPPTQRFPPQGPTAQMPFPPPSGGNPSLLNSMNSGNTTSNNPPLTSINNMSPAIVHKMLNQGASNQGFGNSNTGRSLQPSTQPSTQQLRMLVQQIQMAVQAGYLNHQILNQPLAPQTLILLNQLLQQIKNLQQLMTQQQMAQSQGSLGKPNSQMVLQCSVLITKTKQQIQNLQNQIAAQQAIYVKQQHVGGGSATPADFFKTNMHDSINALQSNFGELAIKDPQSSYQNQQSRLNQWKLPALDKESDAGSEFSRAPGPVTKPLVPSHSSPNLNPLGLGQNDGPWSSGRSAETGGWPDAGSAGDPVPPDVNKDSQWPTSAQPSLTDLVPEFEPGKPWKGNQIKSIEDDPSITPGSVVRSPLSLATIKDSEIFNSSAQPSKVSPPGVSSTDTIQPLSLSSSTWSFNPPTTTPSAFTRMDDSLSKIASSKATWGESAPPPTAVTSELWGVPMAAKPRGPPPGLAKGGSNLSLTANGWNSSSVGGGRSSWGSQTGNWGSPWLLLRNLTAQIDGSTLRTLCMQHGPLQSFHLYLHQGFALVKYSSREEATKAQTALNNCVLGNTTILAESPAESDAQNLLQQLAPQQSASTGAWRASGAKPAADTWNTGWPTNTSASLWGAAPMDNSDPARATPSSLNSFLPGDLLGGESM